MELILTKNINKTPKKIENGHKGLLRNRLTEVGESNF